MSPRFPESPQSEHYHIDSVEQARLDLQSNLDNERTQKERNRLGQFSTPPRLALDILKYARSLFSATEKIFFLDPAIGTGAF